MVQSYSRQHLASLNPVWADCVWLTFKAHHFNNCFSFLPINCSIPALSRDDWLEFDEVLVWLSGARCKWSAYDPADATATLIISCFIIIQDGYFYLSGASLPRLSWKKRPLDGYCCSYNVKNGFSAVSALKYFILILWYTQAGFMDVTSVCVCLCLLWRIDLGWSSSKVLAYCDSMVMLN